MSVSNYIDNSNRVVLPTFIMLVVSLTLFKSLMRMRKRIAENFGSKNVSFNNSKKFLSRIRLLFSLILLNVVNIVFTIPEAVISQYSFSDSYFVFSLYLVYAAYACNFYILYATNSLFRDQFLDLFMKSQQLFVLRKKQRTNLF